MPNSLDSSDTGELWRLGLEFCERVRKKIVNLSREERSSILDGQGSVFVYAGRLQKYWNRINVGILFGDSLYMHSEHTQLNQRKIEVLVNIYEKITLHLD